MGALTDIEVRLSGGLANTNPLLSIGGIKSNTKVLSQQLTGTMAGVAFVDGVMNAEGVGVLTFNFAAKTLTWAPAGGTAGPPVNVAVDGTYAITATGGSAYGYIVVTVTAVNLPSANISANITVANLTQKLFDDVTKSVALAGQTDYRCVYVQNVSAATLTNVKMYINQNTSGADSVEIGLDTAGLNGTAAATANTTTAPVGVSFSAPTNPGVALSLGTLAAGAYYPVWFKRIVPVNTTTGLTADISSFIITALS